MENQKIEINLGAFKLVAEFDDRNAPEYPPELCVYLEGKEDASYQDICVVRPDMTGREFAQDKTPERMECLVWGSENDECYTETFNIPVYHEPDEEDEEEPSTPSSTFCDYGPGNPWDAPGMSVHDFI